MFYCLYFLFLGNDTRYFTIDTNTGNITLAENLQKGSYTLLVEAALPSSENGVTTVHINKASILHLNLDKHSKLKVRVSAVPGAPIAGMHFGSPHYAFHIAERSPSNTLVGVIELRNPNSDIAPRIASVDPGSMSGNFL